MKTNIKSCCKLHAYEAPSAETILVDTERGFAQSNKLEDVGKDDEIEFY